MLKLISRGNKTSTYICLVSNTVNYTASPNVLPGEVQIQWPAEPFITGAFMENKVLLERIM